MPFYGYTPRNRFGALLKAFRHQRRLALKPFGELVGCSHTFISRVETGRRKPPMEMIDRWADVLKLSQAQRTALRIEAGLAFVPDSIREEVRDFLMAEGVRKQRANRRLLGGRKSSEFLVIEDPVDDSTVTDG